MADVQEKLFLTLVIALGAATELAPYIMSDAHIKYMCVTDRRPAGDKLSLTLVTVLDAAGILAPYIMCAPYMKLMCVTGRRPAG